MVVTTNFNVQINNILFVNQPSRLVPKPPKAKRFSPIKGGFFSFSQDFGWEFELEWGSEALSDAEAFEEVAFFYNSNLHSDAGRNTVELKFTWYDGDEYSFTVMWDEAVVAAFRYGTNVEKFSITLREASTTD